MRDRHNLLDSEKIPALSETEIAYGILNDRSSSSILNHLILIGKYFLYSNALEENIKFQFAGYINSVYEKVRVKKDISVWQPWMCQVTVLTYIKKLVCS